MTEARQLKGLEIASTLEIVRDGNIWMVSSQKGNRTYMVNLFVETCTCPDYEQNRTKCKHLYAVELLLLKESGVILPAPEKVVKLAYKQEWHEYTLGQVNEKAKFLELLYALCSQIEEPMQHIGRPRIPVADRIFACCFKIYSTLSGRRFMADLMKRNGAAFYR